MLRHKIPVILAKKETVPKLMPVHIEFIKRELQCIFLGKKAIIIASKNGTTFFFFFFFHYNHFLGKLKEKLARKARVNNDASISDRAHAP